MWYCLGRAGNHFTRGFSSSPGEFSSWSSNTRTGGGSAWGRREVRSRVACRRPSSPPGQTSITLGWHRPWTWRHRSLSSEICSLRFDNFFVCLQNFHNAWITPQTGEGSSAPFSVHFKKVMQWLILDIIFCSTIVLRVMLNSSSFH